MKKDYCDITFLLDKSGSMSKIKDSTIEGYNKFLKEQKEIPGEAKMTLIQFDSVYEVSYEGKNISESVYLNDEYYQPRATTALFDAIGKAITDVGNRLSRLNENKRPDKVVFVILTDGLENASREYTNEKVADMIKHQTEVYDWKFLFLGANQDAIATAATLNINPKMSMSYSANSMSNSEVYRSISKNLGKFRSAGVSAKEADLSFTDEDRTKQEESKNS